MEGPSCQSPPSRAGAAMAGLLGWVGRMQLTRPRLVLLACGLLTALGLFGASRLKLRTEFDQLLPESQPSVKELGRVSALVSGVSNVFVVLEGDETGALRRLGDELVPELALLGPPWVGDCEDGVRAARAFLTPRAGLFPSRDELTGLLSDLQARWDYEVSKKLDTDLGEEPPPPMDAAAVHDRFARTRTELADRFPDGYYQSKNGKAVVVAVHAAIAAGDLPRAAEAMRRIRAVVERVHAAHPSIRVGYTGDLATSLIEYSAVRDDLVEVGTLGVGLVLGVILLFYLRLRTLIALGLTIAAGCAWTFGMTDLFIGHLNVATGFLVSIVAGNGINFGIIYMARYLEARREATPVASAIAIAHQKTWLPTLTAALAAAAAYGSLGVTDFRGFKHFALIGSAGMVLCWLATYAVLPAVLVLIERVAPFTKGAGVIAMLRHRGTSYDAPFAWFVQKAPRLLAVAGVGLACAGALLVVGYVRADPMEYDMKRLRNDVRSRSEQMRLTALAGDIVGQANADAMAIVTERIDQVAPLKRALEAVRDAAPERAKPFERVHTLLDFVPDGQADKIGVLLAIKSLLVRARARGMVDDADWHRIEPFLPAGDLRPFGLDDLPADLARPFTERDGTRGRIVYIEPTAGQNVDDIHYLILWADAFRSTTLPNGEVVLGSGRSVIYADMLATIVSDAPKAVLVSLLMTGLVVLLTFRKGGHTAIVLGTLLVGVAWLGGLLVLFRVRLNFLNFVALPITFGIGVDYAVNVVQRYEQEGSRGVLGVLRSTGGAVVLCSLTTTLGYLALLRSLNQAVRSLGMAAVLGEMCCLLSAVLVLPAALLWHERRRTVS